MDVALRMARKLDPYRETARMARQPWLVEAALARALPAAQSHRSADCQGHSHSPCGNLCWRRIVADVTASTKKKGRLRHHKRPKSREETPKEGSDSGAGGVAIA
jgi:hypothetical protein